MLQTEAWNTYRVTFEVGSVLHTSCAGSIPFFLSASETGRWALISVRSILRTIFGQLYSEMKLAYAVLPPSAKGKSLPRVLRTDRRHGAID